METYLNRDSNHTRRNGEECYNVKNDVYRVLSMGAKIACDSSVDAIFKDSANLPGDKCVPGVCRISVFKIHLPVNFF